MKIYCKIFFLLLFSVILTIPSCKNDESYGKLGIVVPIGDGKVTKKTPYVITGVYENSPADRAGIKPDDIITQVNAVPLKGKKYDFIYKNFLRGKAGTGVTIVVEREGKIFIFDVVRGE